MTIRLKVDSRGFDGVVAQTRGIRMRAENLRPLGFAVRDRWLEAEERVFARRPWTPRAASTRKRYRYPVRRWSKGGRGRMRRGPKGRVGTYEDVMERSLTSAHQKGVRDTIIVGRGSLVAQFGVSPRGPVAHAALFHNGAGSRPRRPVVVFDRQATRDASADAAAYLVGKGRRRNR